MRCVKGRPCSLPAVPLFQQDKRQTATISPNGSAVIFCSCLFRQESAYARLWEADLKGKNLNFRCPVILRMRQRHKNPPGRAGKQSQGKTSRRDASCGVPGSVPNDFGSCYAFCRESVSQHPAAGKRQNPVRDDYGGAENSGDTGVHTGEGKRWGCSGRPDAVRRRPCRNRFADVEDVQESVCCRRRKSPQPLPMDRQGVRPETMAHGSGSRHAGQG